MTVAHIVFQYGVEKAGGAPIAATRLHNALLGHGVNSHYICLYKRGAGVNVHELPQGWRRNLFFTLVKIMRCIWRFTPYRRSICLNIVPLFGLEKVLKEIKPDIVHIQWINADVCSFEQLQKLPYKMIFNLHDLYMILPGAGKDSRFVCGLMQMMDLSWLERFLVRRKECLIRKKASAFIGPSDWVCKMANESMIGCGIPAYSISNIIDECFFAELPQRVQNEKFVILFGAYGGRGNKDKGFEDLVKVFAVLPDYVKNACEFQIFGEDGNRCRIKGVNTCFLGVINDLEELRAVYYKCDIFVFPSLQETQGMTKVEAMLCGAPVIAFARTACAEGICHQKNGWIADAGNIRQFADGIMFYFKQWRVGILEEEHKGIARLAREEYSSKKNLSRIISVYKQVSEDGK